MQARVDGPLIGIVDDDESAREGVSNLLRSAGYRTEVYASAEAFLDLDHRCEVGCVVLDIDMPGLDGLELQRLLTQMNVSIPVIFLTAQDNELGAIALKGGAGAVLGKPVSGEDLLDAIRSALEFPGRSPRGK